MAYIVYFIIGYYIVSTLGYLWLAHGIAESGLTVDKAWDIVFNMRGDDRDTQMIRKFKSEHPRIMFIIIITILPVILLDMKLRGR